MFMLGPRILGKQISGTQFCEKLNLAWEHVHLILHKITRNVLEIVTISLKLHLPDLCLLSNFQQKMNYGGN